MSKKKKRRRHTISAYAKDRHSDMLFLSYNLGMTSYKNELNPNYKGGAFSVHRKEGNSYRAMKARCMYTGYWAYHRYGGRGIKICDRWLGKDGFKHFYEDMGNRPDGTSLDRIDPDGDYCPENCRWSTQKMQVCNSAKKLRARVTSEEMATAVCSIAQVNKRIRNGWNKEDALHTPLDLRKARLCVRPRTCVVCGGICPPTRVKYCSNNCELVGIENRRNKKGGGSKCLRRNVSE